MTAMIRPIIGASGCGGVVQQPGTMPPSANIQVRMPGVEPTVSAHHRALMGRTSEPNARNIGDRRGDHQDGHHRSSLSEQAAGCCPPDALVTADHGIWTPMRFLQIARGSSIFARRVAHVDHAVLHDPDRRVPVAPSPGTFHRHILSGLLSGTVNPKPAGGSLATWACTDR